VLIVVVIVVASLSIHNVYMQGVFQDGARTPQ